MGQTPPAESAPVPLTFQGMERPNTVSGLHAKRDELVRYRKRLQVEIRKITTDIDHLEAAARLFEDGVSYTGIQGHTVRHRARKGTVKRFILAMLRDAQAPLTSAQITEARLVDRGLRPGDDTRIVIRRRIGASLISLRAAGITVNDGMVDGFKGWRVA
jgi:hypothetical protein